MNFRMFLENNKRDFWYHCTFSNAIPSIQQQGLLPSKDTNWGGDLGYSSVGRIYLARYPQDAFYYASIILRKHLENFRQSYEPIMLRVRSQNPETDPEDPRSSFKKEMIPPSNIEVWWNRWLPIAQVNFISEEETIEWNEELEEFEDSEGNSFGTTPEEVVANMKKFILRR